MTDHVRREVQTKLETKLFSKELFDDLQAAVQAVMTDTHCRFKSTAAFKEAVRISMS